MQMCSTSCSKYFSLSLHLKSMSLCKMLMKCACVCLEKKLASRKKQGDFYIRSLSRPCNVHYWYWRLLGRNKRKGGNGLFGSAYMHHACNTSVVLSAHWNPYEGQMQCSCYAFARISIALAVHLLLCFIYNLPFWWESCGGMFLLSPPPSRRLCVVLPFCCLAQLHGIWKVLSCVCCQRACLVMHEAVLNTICLI